MSAPRPLSPAVVLGLLALVAAIAWWPVVDCAFVWDDDDYVTQNPVLRAWGGLGQIWTQPSSLPQFYPLVHTTFWLEYRLWGLSPLGYHIDNVLLHTLAAWRLWRLCPRLGLRVALVPALWFLVHPVHVESVAWITERKNVLSLVCALFAAERWLAWHDGGRRRDIVVGSAWFLGALLSKTVTAAVPGALLVLLWWRDGVVTRRALRAALPWLVVGALLGWFTVHLETTHVRAADARWQLLSAERLLVAGRAPWFYLGCLLWPVGTCFNYPRWQLDTGSLLQWAWPALTVAALALAFALRRQLGRGPLAVLLLFGGMLLPALGFFDVFPFRYSFVADHFQYHASLAVLVGVAAVVVPFAAARLPFAAAVAVLIAMLGGHVALTWRALASYRDVETLWQHTLQANPRSTLALTNLGALANLRFEGPAAKDLFERVLAIDPTSHEAWNNLGVIAHRAGDRATARAHYEKALACKGDDPATKNNLAVLLIEQDRPQEALPLAEQAVASDATYFEGRITLGRALHDCGQWERALAQCDYVLQRLPNHFESRQRAVQCLSRLGRHRPAASNAMVWFRAEPTSSVAKQLLVAELAQVLRSEPAAGVRAMAANALRSGGLEPDPILPLVAQALRQLGATAQADAVAGR